MVSDLARAVQDSSDHGVYQTGLVVQGSLKTGDVRSTEYSELERTPR